MIEQQYIFPRGRVYTPTISDTPTTVLAAGQRQKITHFILSGGAVAKNFMFETVDGLTVYQRVATPVLDTIIIPGFETTTGGLRVYATVAAGDLYLTTFYVLMGG
jgi:hypothetical protein